MPVTGLPPTVPWRLARRHTRLPVCHVACRPQLPPSVPVGSLRPVAGVDGRSVDRLSPFQENSSRASLRYRTNVSRPPDTYRNFMGKIVGRVFDESPSLICAGPPLPAAPQPPLSTERSIVGRLAIYAHDLVSDTFGDHAIVDVEYERIGPGADPKERAGRKVSPDLIFHVRHELRSNFLAVEVKRRDHRWRRAWHNGPEIKDFGKIHFFTHHLEHKLPPGMSSYNWGICLELDSHGVDAWWVTREGGISSCDCLDHHPNCFRGSGFAGFIRYERWNWDYRLCRWSADCL